MNSQNPHEDPATQGARVTDIDEQRLVPLAGASRKRLPAALPLALAGVLAVAGIAFGATYVVPQLAVQQTPVVVHDATPAPLNAVIETQPPATPPAPPTEAADLEPAQQPANDPTADPTTPATAPTPAPAAPGRLTLTASIAEGKVKLAWNAYEGDIFAYYKVVRSNDSAVSWPADQDDTLVAAIADASKTSFIDAAPKGKTFSYAVFAVRSGDEGYAVLAKSGVKTIAVPAPTRPPTATPAPPSGPVSLGAITATKDGEGCYTFSWKGYNGVDFNYWKLVHGSWGTQPYYPAFPYWAVLDPGTTSWHGCIDPGDYAVRVQAIYYPDGEPVAAAQTSILHLVVTGDAPTIAPTVNLGNLTVTAKGGCTYTFSWKAFNAVDFNYWKLVHGPAGSSPTYPDYDYWAALDPSVTSWTGCIQPGDYAVRVQAIYYPAGSAVAAAQTGVYHLVVAAATPTPAPAPANLPATAEITADGVALSWTAYAGDGFQYYKIVRSETNTSPTFPVNNGTTLVAAISTKSTTKWVDPDAQAGHTYYYRVLAVRSDGSWVILAKSSVLKVVVP